MIIAALMGLVLGSFLNVCIYRIPRGESISYPPSRCPACGTRLRPKDLVPVFSWVFLGGRCRYCKGPIRVRYPLVEALTSFAFAAVSTTELPLPSVVASYLTALVLIAVTFIDIDTKRIPDVITYPAAVASVVLSAMPGGQGVVASVIGLAAGGGFLYAVAVLSRGGMGIGDAKLMAVVGAAFGWRVALYAIFIGSVIGSVVGVALLATKVITRKQPIPFGPFLAAGTAVAWALAYAWPHSGYLPF